MCRLGTSNVQTKLGNISLFGRHSPLLFPWNSWKKNLRGQVGSSGNTHEEFLVGGWTNPSEKYARQNGFIFPNFRGENSKNIWIDHLDFYLSSPDWCATDFFELTVQIGQSNPCRFVSTPRWQYRNRPIPIPSLRKCLGTKGDDFIKVLAN